MDMKWKYLIGIDYVESSEAKRGQASIARKLMGLFIPVLMGFVYFNWIRDHQTLAVIEAVIVMGMIFSVTRLWRTHPYILPWMGCGIVSALAIVIFIDGGVGKMALLWLMLAPFIYFTLLGQRWGCLISGLLLLSVLVIKNFTEIAVPYSHTQMFVFVLAYSFQSLVAAAMNLFRMHRELYLIHHEEITQKALLKLETHVQEEAATWQETIDNIDDAMLVLNGDGHILKWNRSAKEMVPDGLLKKDGVDGVQFLTELNASYHASLVKKARQAGESFEDEIFVASTKQWFLLSLKPLKSDFSDQKQSLLRLINITGRHLRDQKRQADLHYLQSMQQINQVITNASDAHMALHHLISTIRNIFKADRAWLLTPCDPDAESYNVPIEATADEYPGAFLDVADIPIDDEVQSIFTAALATHQAITFPDMPDVEALRKYSIRSQMILAIRGHEGTPWMLGIHQCSHAKDWNEKERALFKDVGERLAGVLDFWRLNENLERRSDQYRQLVENMPDAVIILSDSKIVFANEVMLDMVGKHSMADVLDCNLADFIHPDCLGFDVVKFSSSSEGEKSPIHEILLVNTEGDKVETIARSMQILFHGQAAIQVILRNVTRRNEMDRTLKISAKRNKQLAREVINIQERERVMIAQDLHDDSGQLLTAMSANLQSIKNNVPDERMRGRIEDTEKMVGQIFKSIRSSLTTLNPTHIDILGLSDAVRSEVEAWSLRHDVPVMIEVSKAADFPSPETATTIFRIIQEALTNIAKHARAEYVWVSLGLVVNHPSYITLEIKDDGCGFDQGQTQHEGFGLFGMLSRAELVSAVFTLESQVGVGTTIHVDFPIHPLEPFGKDKEEESSEVNDHEY